MAVEVRSYSEFKMRKKYTILIVLISYTLIILLPPIMYGYIYPNNSDDTAFHLYYFNKLQQGGTFEANYLGQYILGYAIVWLSNISNLTIEFIFLWFNFIVLWLIGFTAFFVSWKLVSWKAGLIALPMVIFVTPSTLNLYDCGSIYDLMTVGIFLPLSVYCAVKLLVTKKFYWAIPLLVSAGLVLFIHTIGALGSNGNEPIVSFSQFANVFIGTIPLLIFFGSLIIVACRYKEVEYKSKILGIILSCIVLAMATLVFSGLIGWSIRIALDLSIVLALFTACLLGMVIKLYPDKIALIGIALVVLCSSIPVMSGYFKYNSAITKVDKQVIAYINSLEGQYYSCSPEVAPWVYDLFLDKKYKEDELPYISRNQPMTNRTKPESVGYWWEQTATGYIRKDYSKGIPDYNLEEAILFKEGDLRIYVIEK